MGAIFADIRTPEINELTLKRNLASRTKENVFQGIITRPEECVTEKYSTDTDAAEIQVIRQKPDDREARNIGADINGGYFNDDDATQPKSAAYGIKILTTIDHNIDIPSNAQGMINVDLAEGELSNLTGKVNRNINAATVAAQLCKNFNDKAKGVIADNWVTITKANVQKGDWKNALIDAAGKLDEGNPAEGVDMYPSEKRAFLIRPAVRSALMREGEIIVGGSNYAQDLVAEGGLSPTAKRFTTDGYAGTLDGIPVYVCAPAVFLLAEKYLGLAAGSLDNVYALCVSAIGTGRALAFNDVINTIPSPKGQGIRLQPKYRFGVECWDGLSVVPVVETGYSNPGGSLELKAPGSRAYTLVTFKVQDASGALSGATLTISGNVSATAAVEGEGGEYTFTVERGTTASVKVEKTGYTAQTISITAANTASATYEKTVTLVAAAG